MHLHPEDDAIVRLWDELSDFDAAQTGEACRHLMERLATLVNAKNVGWVGATRTSDDPADPLRGWRIPATTYWRDEPLNAATVAEMKTLWAKREVDPLSRQSVVGAGEHFRAFTLRHTMEPEWFDAPYYKVFYEGRGVQDAIIILFPLNQDAESAFVLHGGPDRGDFTEDELALVVRALRGIKWFHRRIMLDHGLIIASSPLTPAERRALAELLTDASEKQIADRLDLAASTVHQYAASIYRKFAVKGRAGLMSLWLNKSG